MGDPEGGALAMSLEYALLQSEDFDAAARVLTDAFTRREPLGVAAGIVASDFDAFLRVLAPKIIDDDLTVVARNEAGEIVGVMLNEDSGTPPPDGFDTLSRSFVPIWEFLHELEVEHRADGRDPLPGEWLHLFLLAVAEEACGQGVAQGMVAASLENAKGRGYSTAVVEATGPISQNIFRKQGFTDRVFRPYAGHPVFSSVAHAGGTILMDRPI
jgi:predicted N-acetyltransferase YhbS